MRAAGGATAQVLNLALPRVAAYAVGKALTKEISHGLLASERARVRVVDYLLRLDRHLQLDGLAVPSVYHKEYHVRVVYRQKCVLQVVASHYALVRVVVLGIHRSVA